MSSFSYERYDRHSARNRGTFTYWVPLVVTVTLAAGGLAAWIWSARDDHESSSSSEDENLSYGEESVERRAAATAGGARPPSYGVSEGIVREDDHSDYRQSSEVREESSRNVTGQMQEGTLFDRVQGAIRRTPSPQQMMDIAGKRVAAGVAAAGAAVGSALSAIHEEDRDYEDHERWSEEAEIKNTVTAASAESATAVATHAEAFASSVRDGPSATTSTLAPATGTKRKTVAVVVSGESVLSGLDEEQGSYTTEQAVRHRSDSTDSKIQILRYNQLYDFD